jgi:hypothetical protein
MLSLVARREKTSEPPVPSLAPACHSVSKGHRSHPQLPTAVCEPAVCAAPRCPTVLLRSRSLVRHCQIVLLVALVDVHLRVCDGTRSHSTASRGRRGRNHTQAVRALRPGNRRSGRLAGGWAARPIGTLSGTAGPRLPHHAVRALVALQVGHVRLQRGQLLLQTGGRTRGRGRVGGWAMSCPRPMKVPMLGGTQTTCWPGTTPTRLRLPLASSRAAHLRRDLIHVAGRRGHFQPPLECRLLGRGIHGRGARGLLALQLRLEVRGRPAVAAARVGGARAGLQGSGRVAKLRPVRAAGGEHGRQVLDRRGGTSRAHLVAAVLRLAASDASSLVMGARLALPQWRL